GADETFIDQAAIEAGLARQPRIADIVVSIGDAGLDREARAYAVHRIKDVADADIFGRRRARENEHVPPIAAERARALVENAGVAEFRAERAAHARRQLLFERC